MRNGWRLLGAAVVASTLVWACEEDAETGDDDDGTSVSATTTGTTTGTSTSASTSASTSTSTSASTTSTGGMSAGGMSAGGMSSGGMSAGGNGGGTQQMGCLTATALPLGTPVGDAIDPAGDDDFFTFSASAGDWIAIVTVANPDDDPLLVDTVITLYSANGAQQLAENDDAVPRISTDSEIVYHVPQTGSYCVRVQEFSEWSGDVPEGSPTYVYDVLGVALDPTTFSWFNQDSDPTPTNNTLGTAQALATDPDNFGGDFCAVGALLTPGTDVDFYSYATPAGTLSTMVELTPQGISGYGSTQGPGAIRLRNGSGVVAELDYQLGAGQLYFPAVGSGAYSLEVTRPNATVGTNDFFYFKLANRASANEDEVESNNTAAAADAPMGQVNGAITSYFVRGTVSPAATDVDYVSFVATAGQTLGVSCSAARVGSGLSGFTVTARSINDLSTLQTETEVATQNLVWSTVATATMPPVALAQTGTYYVRLTATSQSSTVSGSYYICGLHVQ